MWRRGILTRTLIALTTSVAIGMPANAYPTWVGNWLIEDVTNVETEFCLATGSYPSGEDLLFLVSDYGFSVGIANQTWTLPLEMTYGMDLVVDWRVVASAQAYVPLETLVRVDLGWDVDAIQAFRSGRLFTARHNKGYFEFGLDGTAAAISEALRCYFSEIDARSSTNPFEGVSGNSTNPFESSRGAEEEIPASQFYASFREVESWFFDVDPTIVVIASADNTVYDVYGKSFSGWYFELLAINYDSVDSAASLAASLVGETCGRYGVEPVSVGNTSIIAARRIVCEDGMTELLAVMQRDRIGILIYSKSTPNDEPISRGNELLLIGSAITQ